MYNIYLLNNVPGEYADMFGSKYDLTDDITQANVILTEGEQISDSMLESKLVFAAIDLSENGLDNGSVECCSTRGTVVFRCTGESGAEDIEKTIGCAKDYIENGNISCSVNFPDVSLGPFGDDVSRISVLMKGIDAPILLGAMMTSEMDLRAIAGGLKKDLGAALIAGREPVTRIPHVEGVLKVRVLQDI